jgi:hypothetical protein
MAGQDKDGEAAVVRRHARKVNLNEAVGIINSLIISSLFWVLIGSIFWACTADAAPPDNRPPKNRPPNNAQPIQVEASSQAAAASQSQSAAASKSISGAASYAEGGQGGAGGAGGSGGNATAGSVSEGGNASVTNNVSVFGEGSGAEGQPLVDAGDTTINGGDTNFNSESNNTNVVLVPNNNTANCLRVYGLSFGNGDGAGALGVPFRDKACDYEAAADDAAAMGEHKIAWWWRCHKPNLRKTFKMRGDTDEMAQLKCWNSMVEMLEPQANADDWVTQDQLMAQVSKEEYQEQAMMVERQIAEQRELIESLKADHDDKDAEIERLKREAARLRAEQKEQEDRDAARRAAALKALAKKSEDD